MCGHTCKNTPTRNFHPPHTHVRLKHATKDLITFSKLWMAQCFPELCLLKPVTLIPTSLLKHTFIDTNGILSCPHIDSCCWQGMEVCRSGECWWALTPKGPVLGNSNNSEPAHASLLKKKKKSGCYRNCLFNLFQMALSGAVLWHGAKTYLLFPATQKKSRPPWDRGEEASEYGNSALLQVFICVWEY